MADQAQPSFDEDTMDNTPTVDVPPITLEVANEIVKTSPVFDYDDADFTMVSSDGVAFRVHQFMIKCASMKLFGRAVDHTGLDEDGSPQSPRQKIIYLSHKILEHSLIVGFFLGLLYDIGGTNCDFRDTRFFLLVIRFCRSWASVGAIERLDKELQLSCLNDRAHPVQHFLVAVELRSNASLRHALARESWPDWSPLAPQNLRSRDIPDILKYFPNDLEATDPWGPEYPQSFRLGSWALALYDQIPLTAAWIVMDNMHGYDTYYSKQNGGWSIVAKTIADQIQVSYQDDDDEITSEAGADEEGGSQRSMEGTDTGDEGGTTTSAEGLVPGAKHESSPATALTKIVSYSRDDSDLVIISSDNVSFSVHAARLRRVSPVLREMIPGDIDGAYLGFTDELLEHSTIFAALFDIIYDYEVVPLENIGSIIYLVRLADKWDIPLVNRIIKDHFEKSFYDCRNDPFHLFQIAIELQDYGSAGRIIEQYDQRSSNGRALFPDAKYPLPPPRYDRLSEYVECPSWQLRRAEDIWACPYVYFIELPPRVSWALLRAAHIWRPTWPEEDFTLIPPSREARRTSIAASFKHMMDPATWPTRGISEKDWERQRAKDEEGSEDGQGNDYDPYSLDY